VENSELDQTPSFLDELIRLVKTLRGKHGCPWDKKQTPRNVSVYLIEEGFELADAIEAGHPEQIREELGDVLFHIVFIARMFQERGEFSLSDVAQTITEKMIRRHPHVFGEESVKSSQEVVENWHKIKLSEKKSTSKQSSLDSVPVQLPALIRAYRISDRAAKSGFDWAEVDGTLENVEQELGGLKAILKKQNNTNLSQKFGDLLFLLVNIARLAKIHPETALAGSNKKFELRFRKMEDLVSESERDLENISGREKALIWEKVKKIVQ
jgi:tetrapyrrole methylase family protein/MazG family protein